MTAPPFQNEDPAAPDARGAPGEERTPRRRGRRFPRRLLIVLGVFFGCLATLAGIAGWFLFRDIAPPDDSDLAPATVSLPDAENGYFELLAAVEALQPADEEEEDGAYVAVGSVFDEDWDEAGSRRLIEKNGAVFEAIDRCLALPGFKLPETTSFDDALPIPVTGARGVAYLLVDRARLLLEEGDPNRALEDALRMARVGHVMAQGRGVLVSLLVGSALRSMGLRAVRDVASRVPDAARVRVAMREVESLSPSVAAWSDVLTREYRLCAALIDDPGETLGALAGYTGPLLMRPNETKKILGDAYRLMIRNLEAPPADREELPEKSKWFSIGGTEIPVSIRNLGGRLLHDMISPTVALATARLDEARCHHRATIAYLALRCHQLERGELPETLEALTPEYLAEVPRDPWDGEPLRYSRERGLLWGIGEDLVDDGGDAGADVVVEIGSE